MDIPNIRCLKKNSQHEHIRRLTEYFQEITFVNS